MQVGTQTGFCPEAVFNGVISGTSQGPGRGQNPSQNGWERMAGRMSLGSRVLWTPSRDSFQVVLVLNKEAKGSKV